MKCDMMYLKKKSPTKYGKNSNEKDFVESVAKFTHNRSTFETDFSNRTVLLKLLFK